MNREQTVEDYVAGVAASQISWEYSKETIKAQVVLARTNLSVKSEKERKEISDDRSKGRYDETGSFGNLLCGGAGS